eukprot:Awhi_evm1s14282
MQSASLVAFPIKSAPEKEVCSSLAHRSTLYSVLIGTAEHFSLHDFRVYLKDVEFSAENLHFWEAVQKMKTMSKVSTDCNELEKLQDYTEKLWNRYLKPMAPMQVNVSDTTRGKLEKSLNQELLDCEIWFNAQKEVLQLMESDSFVRFVEWEKTMIRQRSIKPCRSEYNLCQNPLNEKQDTDTAPFSKRRFQRRHKFTKSFKKSSLSSSINIKKDKLAVIVSDTSINVSKSSNASVYEIPSASNASPNGMASLDTEVGSSHQNNKQSNDLDNNDDNNSISDGDVTDLNKDKNKTDDDNSSIQEGALKRKGSKTKHGEESKRRNS